MGETLRSALYLKRQMVLPVLKIDSREEPEENGFGMWNFGYKKSG